MDWSSFLRASYDKVYREVLVVFGGACFLIFVAILYAPSWDVLRVLEPLGPFATNVVALAFAYVTGRLLYLVGRFAYCVACLPIQLFGPLRNSGFFQSKLPSIKAQSNRMYVTVAEKSAQQRIFLFILTGAVLFMALIDFYREYAFLALVVVFVVTVIEELQEEYLDRNLP